MTALKIKIMPESLDISLDSLKKEVEEKVPKLGGKISSLNEEDIAFGLKALIVTIAWPEDKETGMVEAELAGIEGVSSAQIIDYRRAFG